MLTTNILQDSSRVIVDQRTRPFEPSLIGSFGEEFLKNLEAIPKPSTLLLCPPTVVVYVLQELQWGKPSVYVSFDHFRS
jgi:hypothetical protein